jgi:hypothetical protein
MYKLKATIKCPAEGKAKIVECLRQYGVDSIEEERIPYGKFILESRMYWDFVHTEMQTDEKDVYYLYFFFDDTAEGRILSHEVELKLGWIPLNLRYVTGT